MSATELAILQAPVNYTDVRVRVNTVRAFFGTVVGVMAISGIIQGLSLAPWILLISLYLFADGMIRRKRGTSAIPMLLTDTLVAAAIGLVKGNVGLSFSATFLYVLTGALLLLPIPRALAMIATSLAIGVPVIFVAPLGNPVISQTRYHILDVVVISLLSLLVGSLLYGAAQALHASTLRHRAALAAERRAVELKNEFVSMVSHEFRTPLTSIAGFSETLRSNWPDLEPDEIDEFLIIMREEAHHLSDLVEDILVIPRIEAGRLRLRLLEFDLASEIESTTRLVFTQGGKEIDMSVPGGVIVNADRGRTGQILRNLLDNARKYGGDSVEISGEEGTDIYTITVSDNGPGIPDSDWEKIFEHFEQLNKGDSRSSDGVGLGLPIARQLARAMGGDVWYTPRFPTGASFRFSLPLSRIIKDGTSTPTADAESGQGSGHPVSSTET